MAELDVVCVPDFSGPAPRVFEARTLMFLGAWQEHTGASRAWPLHLACIGEPPESVRALAKECGASITRHEPIPPPLDRTFNKLRGFEVSGRTERFLLLDVDTVVLGDLSAALELGRGVAALPAIDNPIALPLWEEAYRALDVTLPAERMRCLRGEFRAQLPSRLVHASDALEMPPYFNSGVLLAPWKTGLREAWESCGRRLKAFAEKKGKDGAALTVNDQPSLAVAIAQCLGERVPFRRLPPELHGNPLFLWAGALPYERTRLFHALTLFRRGARDGPLDFPGEVSLFEQRMLARIRPHSLAEHGAEWLRRWSGQDDPPQAAAIRKLCARLRELVRRYVEPVPGPSA